MRIPFLIIVLCICSCSVFRPWYYDSKYPEAKSAYVGSNGKPSSDVLTLAMTIGLNKSSIIEVFGAPNRMVSDGAGGEIIVYEVERTIMIDYTKGTNSRGTFFREFYLDGNGIVARFKFGYR
jgi:hypothetical protein